MKAFLLLLTFLLVLATASVTHAQYVVQPPPIQQIPNLLINKTAKNPQSGVFVDNLTVGDPHFLPSQDVNFRIEVKNTGNTDLNNIIVKDQLPSSLDFVSGPGSFDSGSRTLNFTIDKLSPDQSKTFEILAKVTSTSALPNVQVNCVTNLAETRVNQLVNQDVASLCIEKQVLAPVQELPVTGPEHAIAILAGSSTFLLMAISFYILSRTKKSLA